MRQSILVLLMLSAFSIVTNGKVKVKVIIDIDNKKFAAELVEAVKAKLNSTDRYAVVSNTYDNEILLSLTCLENTSIANHQLGFTCASDVLYYPFIGSALDRELAEAETIVGGGPDGTEFMAVSLVNRFINGTTDENLAKAKSDLLILIRSFCSSRPRDCAMQDKK